MAASAYGGGDDGGSEYSRRGRETSPAPDVLQDVLRNERRFRPGVRSHRGAPDPGADLGVEELREAVRDLKADVRMLKVGLDKQGQVLDEIVAVLRHLDTRR